MRHLYRLRFIRLCSANLILHNPPAESLHSCSGENVLFHAASSPGTVGNTVLRANAVSTSRFVNHRTGDTFYTKSDGSFTESCHVVIDFQTGEGLSVEQQVALAVSISAQP